MNRRVLDRALSLLLLLTAGALVAANASAAEPHSKSPLPLGQPAELDVLPERLATLKAGMQKFIDEGKHAGISYAIARGGTLVEWQTLGVRDLASGKPLERDTICRIYSMSKIITSVGVLCLLEDGKLRLDDPLSAWLPAFKDPQVMVGGTADAPQLEPAKRPITILNLLTHTSGYTYDFFGPDGIHLLYQRAKLWDAPSLDEFVARAAKLPLKLQPGAEFNYGISDDILGAVIEKASGQKFEEFLDERIFKPLAMSDTSFDVAESKRDRLATISQHAAPTAS